MARPGDEDWSLRARLWTWFRVGLATLTGVASFILIAKIELTLPWRLFGFSVAWLIGYFFSQNDVVRFFEDIPGSLLDVFNHRVLKPVLFGVMAALLFSR